MIEHIISIIDVRIALQHAGGYDNTMQFPQLHLCNRICYAADYILLGQQCNTHVTRLSSFLINYTCSGDPAMKQYIKYLDEQNLLGKKFILHDLDEVHLFVASDVARQLQHKLDELMERNSYSDVGQEGSRIRKEW